MAELRDTDILTARQYNAIAALMVEPSIRKAAEAASIPERTLYKWLKSPAFTAEYRIARREAVQHAVARVQQVSGAAVSVLAAMMARDTVSPAVRVAAASKLIDIAIRAVELEDIEGRLQALERAYYAQNVR